MHSTRAYQDLARDPATAPGLNEELIGYQGDGDKGSHYAGPDTPFIKALVETDGLMGVFSGHDHGIE